MSFRAEREFIDDESEWCQSTGTAQHIQNKQYFLSLSTTSNSTSSSHIMSNVDWDAKLVIGQKAKAAKVTKNASDLNGASRNGPHGTLKLILPSFL